MSDPGSRLNRRLGLPAATVLGIAAMLGTGVFAVWSPALVLAGSWLIGAVAIAAVVAALNAQSTARLAMVHPESGGAYAYGRIELNRGWGITAGIAFIIGKTASAAAAALVIGAYLFPEYQRLTALVVIALALLIDISGVHRSAVISGAIAIIVLLILSFVAITGSAITGQSIALPDPTPLGLLAAAALCFFAFAGYARITVLGEEVRQPARTIPRAVALSLSVVTVVYLILALVVVHVAQSGRVLGAAGFLDIVPTDLAWVVQLGVLLAAGAALIALIAGISRTVFAMAAQGDLPRCLGTVHGGLPRRAQGVAALIAAVIAMVGTIPWSLALSAATVLAYYAVAHLAALRRWPRSPLPVLGIVGCLALIGGLAGAALTGGLALP
jgi:APA family basic amino acid/polyamine antiporter